MSDPKPTRNAPCPCGSGRKLKHCCASRARKRGDVLPESGFEKRMRKAVGLSVEQDENSLLHSIEQLEALSRQPDLNSDERHNALLSLAQAYRFRGRHKDAISTLELIRDSTSGHQDRSLASFVKGLVASSRHALGEVKEACVLFRETLDELEREEADTELIAGVRMEAGKAFLDDGDVVRARQCWERVLRHSEWKQDTEMIARSKANLGLLLLNGSNETDQASGLKLIEESSTLKRAIGDLDGLASNYCNLGLYYWGKKRYERAIAYLRRDLHLSRRVGDMVSICTSLHNLAELYRALRQLGAARTLLAEAEAIGSSLGNEKLVETTRSIQRKIEEVGAETGRAGEKVGPGANCACRSGKKYEACCGRADFEPVDIPAQFGGLAEDLDETIAKVKQAGREPSRLDYILRRIDQSKVRFAWSRMHVHDGWLEMTELPDMASNHLEAARTLAEEAGSQPESLAKPLACGLLAVCSVEAFANQVSFHLQEVSGLAESKLHVIPPELVKDVIEFQRRTELTQKLEILGKALCGVHWPPDPALWTDFRNLVHIRNQLVHFKSAEYEQVVPPPKGPHDILRRVPATVGMRSIPHSWPFRLLTPSFAKWSVSVAESVINCLKDGYLKARTT